MKPKVQFFVRVRDPELLRRVEFYANDIDMLTALGFEVETVTTLRAIRKADFYFVWWWTWAWWPILVATILRRPVIVTGTMDLWKHRVRPWWQRHLIEWSLGVADANVFISDFEMREVPSALMVRNPCLAPCGIDTNKYRPGPERDPHLVLTVSSMRRGNAERKGIPDLIRSVPLIVAKNPRARFVLAGAFDPIYPAMARDLGVSEFVTFPGVISEATKVELMQRCAVYLQPSMHEGFGVATAEAMSCGAPVVTTRVGAVPEVGGESVVYVEPGSTESIAEAVLNLLADRSSAARFGSSARARIESRYSTAHHLAHWRRVLTPALTGMVQEDFPSHHLLHGLLRRLIGVKFLQRDLFVP